MSEPQSSSSSALITEERRVTPDILVSDSDGRFFQSLCEFIEHEKRYLQCPEEGPDELRYIIYRSAFNKVPKSYDEVQNGGFEKTLGKLFQ